MHCSARSPSKSGRILSNATTIASISGEGFSQFHVISWKPVWPPSCQQYAPGLRRSAARSRTDSPSRRGLKHRARPRPRQKGWARPYYHRVTHAPRRPLSAHPGYETTIRSPEPHNKGPQVPPQQLMPWSMEFTI